MKSKFWIVLALLAFRLGSASQACIWDSKTLSQEKREHPTLAEAILKPQMEVPDMHELTNRIQNLKAHPSTNDPAWWNDFAGAYLRLGQPAEAVKILEPITNKFSGDYGVHANLGTAYHLMGRYKDAEREIRRDLEINPDGHFGLEKYHLALLQYLSQGDDYRLRHVYVDELTYSFLTTPQYARSESKTIQGFKKSDLSQSERRQMEEAVRKTLANMFSKHWYSDNRESLETLAMDDEPPPYSTNWDLGTDSKLDSGVIYMATLNQQEPACWVMLGMVATRHWDLNLAKTAFEKAIQLGSPQQGILQWRIDELKKFHPKILGFPYSARFPLLGAVLVIAYYLFRIWKWVNRTRYNQRI